ncbi:hypothetical protein KI387_008831, partial [Taxus chinensis]
LSKTINSDVENFVTDFISQRRNSNVSFGITSVGKHDFFIGDSVQEGRVPLK